MRAIILVTTFLALALALALGGDADAFAQPSVVSVPLASLPLFESITRLTPSAPMQACSLLLFVAIVAWRKLRVPV